MKTLAHKDAKFNRRLYGGGHDLPSSPSPPPVQKSVKFGDLLELYLSFKQITFKLGSFSGFKVFFPAVFTIFC